MKIIALGGGEIGRPGFQIETTLIDKEIIKLSGKQKPKLLFIPTASSDSESYCKIVENYFGKKLKCQVDFLLLINNKLSTIEKQNKILNSDIIYVGGGNTLKMMNIWKKEGVDKLLIEASKKDIILSGISAGSICWFKYGNSDSRKMKNKEAAAIKVSGIGFINALHCPHYNFEKTRKPELKKMTKSIKEVSIALDNCCAIEIIDDKYRILNSKPSAKAYKVYWKNGIYHENLINKKRNFSPLKELLTK